MVRIFKQGDMVWWTDPDSNLCSGHYKVESGNDNEVTELRGDEVILIKARRGFTLTEALADELRRLAKGKMCPDCDWELYDEYGSQFKYWCSMCENSLYGFEVD